jgi:hypothetical protein
MSVPVRESTRSWRITIGWAASGLALGVVILLLAGLSYSLSVIILRLFGPLNTEGLALDVGKSALGALVVWALVVFLASTTTLRATAPGWIWVAVAAPSVLAMGLIGAAQEGLLLFALSALLGLFAAWGSVNWRTWRVST